MYEEHARHTIGLGALQLHALRLQTLERLQVLSVVLLEPIAQLLDLSAQIAALAALSVLSDEVEARADEHEGDMTNKTQSEVSGNTRLSNDGLPVADAALLEGHARRVLLFLHPQMTVLEDGIQERAQASARRRLAKAVNRHVVDPGDGEDKHRGIALVVKPVEWNAEVVLRDRRPNPFLGVLDGSLHELVVELLLGDLLCLLHLDGDDAKLLAIEVRVVFGVSLGILAQLLGRDLSHEVRHSGQMVAHNVRVKKRRGRKLRGGEGTEGEVGCRDGCAGAQVVVVGRQ